MSTNNNAVFAFEVSVVGTNWTAVINARTRGQAKREYHLQVTDAWPDIPYTAVRCRKLGASRSSDEFIRNAEYRGLPGARCGQRVRVGKGRGVIVGHNSSANFDVLFDSDSPTYPGQRLNVHPAACVMEGQASD